MRKTINTYFGDNIWLELDWFDLQKLKKLKAKAEQNKQESFTFKKTEVLVSYAKYVIEFLENKFY